MTDCEASPEPAPEGRQGPEAELVSRGIPIPLSRSQNSVPRWLGTSDANSNNLFREKQISVDTRKYPPPHLLSLQGTCPPGVRGPSLRAQALTPGCPSWNSQASVEKEGGGGAAHQLPLGHEWFRFGAQLCALLHFFAQQMSSADVFNAVLLVQPFALGAVPGSGGSSEHQSGNCRKRRGAGAGGAPSGSASAASTTGGTALPPKRPVMTFIAIKTNYPFFR